MTHASYWTASDGTQLHYRYDDFTDPWEGAPLVVLLHPGLGSSLRLFGWVPHLARKYRVVRPDIRGHGRSEPGPESGLEHERLALDLTELFVYAHGRHNVFDYLPERCCADALAFLRKHFPEERS